MLEEAAQKKADQTPPIGPVCGNKLSRVTQGHERSYQTRLHPIIRWHKLREQAWGGIAAYGMDFRGFVLKPALIFAAEGIESLLVALRALAETHSAELGCRRTLPVGIELATNSHALNEQELSVVCGENQLWGIEGGVFGRDLSSERVVLGKVIGAVGGNGFGHNRSFEISSIDRPPGLGKDSGA